MGMAAGEGPDGRFVPGDLDGDRVVSDDEMVAARESYSDGEISSEELSEMEHVHDNYPRTIVDGSGAEVTIYRPVERVVCTTPQQLETFRSIKVPKETIVGVPQDMERYSYLSEFAGHPSIGHFYEFDLETILALEPDVVIVHPGPGPIGGFDELLTKLDDSGLAIFRFRCNVPETYSEEVEKLGFLFEREAEAGEFLEFYENVLDSVEERVTEIPDEDKPKVYCEYDVYKTSPSDVYPITMAGGRYIFEGAGPVREVDPEAVIAANPDVIIRLVSYDDFDAKAAGDDSRLKAAMDEVLNRTELQGVKAVQEGRVYAMAAPFWTYLPYCSCRYFVGIEQMAKWFHPDLFEDIDPEETHQRYLSEFQGLDYDLLERGAFVYPSVN
ncbi:MAG TPA: ABC transporter substrate-binding protein [Methanothrix sp.]|nr:ABC transporter substrate-binding protein [Methanothrix sp.]HPR67224.1 ABC transporter substrate-binding protein [Methanothrix sp.]